ncbi:MAG TPA: hypothetical protein VFV19_15530 [Candidatus Polarisedimenticolaceae bacterium]|nr:hypothetical protein [Candidatus Polarisedimenticolaceae bacterium]
MTWLLAVALLLAPAETAPMTNEDVVRMVAAGAAEAAILDEVRSRPAAFDVSDDMVDELKVAGVPPAVITAMKARAREAAPPPPPPPVRPPRGTVHLVVAVNGRSPKTLKAPAFADEELKHRLQLAKENEEREVKDLAVFLACTTAEHVPDQWRQKSPLGRDMTNAFRHEMLAFVPGDTPAGKKPKLTLPETLEADVDDVEPHALVVGVAARIGDRWMVLALSTPVKVTPEKDAAPLDATIGGAGADFAFKAALAAKKTKG